VHKQFIFLKKNGVLVHTEEKANFCQGFLVSLSSFHSDFLKSLARYHFGKVNRIGFFKAC
jgi:hypothetical protein